MTRAQNLRSPPPGRPKAARAPWGLRAAAPGSPARAWTARRGADSGGSAACKASAACAAAKRGGQGFTLVEVLIALVLLALLMLVLTSALRTMGQVESRVEQRVEAADDYRLTTTLLDDALGRVSARRHGSGSTEGPTQIPFFQAGPDSLAWIGVMPARFGLGGRHYLRLALERGAGGNQLVLRYAPWDGSPAFDAWGQAQGQVLAAPVGAMALRYMDPASGQWSPVWPPAGVAAGDLPITGLPTAVEIQVDGPAPAWPPLIVALLPTYDSDPSAIRGSFGGGSRTVR